MSDTLHQTFLTDLPLLIIVLWMRILLVQNIELQYSNIWRLLSHRQRKVLALNLNWSTHFYSKQVSLLKMSYYLLGLVHCICFRKALKENVNIWRSVAWWSWFTLHKKLWPWNTWLLVFKVIKRSSLLMQTKFAIFLKMQ